MENAESQSFPADSVPIPPVAKRIASEEPNTTPSAKRSKASHDGSTESPAIPWRIPFPDKPAVLEERNGDIHYRVVNNDGAMESWIILTGLKCLFQKQLPKMPKDYISRLVYDRTHTSITIVKLPWRSSAG
ncbi:hypothetical protein ACJ41O_000379 [Fusarium nematophilum]